MQINTRLLKYIDWPMLVVVGILLGIGLLAIASATGAHVLNEGGTMHYVRKQIAAILAGVFVMVIIMAMNYEMFRRLTPLIYWGIIGLLIIVLIPGIGKEVYGAQRWIPIGSFQLQPSEFAKIALVVALADMLCRKQGLIQNFFDLIPVLAYVGLPLVLILRQPDLGTTMIMVVTTLAMLYVGNVKPAFLAGLTGAGLIGSPILWQLLKDYQRKRLLVFLNPAIDPLGDGYQIIQSRIAIGSGELWGQGLFAGTQNQLKFLPMRHTDFIFSVIGEEFGFIGGMLVLLLFFFFLWRGIRVALEAKDLFGTIVAVGLVASIAFQMFINAGMAMGIMPVTGKTLPFISYGGTSVMSNLICVGLLQTIYMRRQKIMF
jgi:rod shape determining protein RodA